MFYKIIYAHTIDGIEAKYQYSLKDHLVNEWLKTNCKGNYYHSPGWTTEKFIEFEQKIDATMFALRWG